jgi:hypothetical protein
MSTLLGGCCGCKSCELLSWGGLTLGIKVFDIPTSGAEFNDEATDEDKDAYASGGSYTLFNYGECGGAEGSSTNTSITCSIFTALDDCSGEVTVWRNMSGTCCKYSQTGGQCEEYDEQGNCIKAGNPFFCEPFYASVQIGTADHISGKASVIDNSKLKSSSSGTYDNGNPWCSLTYPYNFSDNQVYVIYTQDPYCEFSDEYGIVLPKYSTGQSSGSGSTSAYFTLSFNYSKNNYEVR